MGRKTVDGKGNVFVQAGRVTGEIRFSGGNVQVTGEESGESCGRMSTVINGSGNAVVQADAIDGDITFGS